MTEIETLERILKIQSFWKC